MKVIVMEKVILNDTEDQLLDDAYKLIKKIHVRPIMILKLRKSHGILYKD